MTLLRTLSATFAVAFVLAGCEDDAEVEALEKQIEEQDAEIRTLKDDLVEGSNRIGFLEGQIQAGLDAFDTALKDGLAACRVEQNDDVLREQLTRIEASCVKLSEEVQVAVNCSANPPPAGCPTLPDIAAEEDKLDTTEENSEGRTSTDDAQLPAPDCTQFPNLPACRPLRRDDPPPEGSNIGGENGMEQTVLLAGAYIACTYYTAGACAIAVSAVADALGIGEGDVRKNMESSFKDLGEAVDRGVEIPDPNGKPLVLTLRTATDLIEANKAYNALPQPDRDNPCKVIEIFRTVEVVDEYLRDLLNPLQFRNQQQKATAIAVAREVDLKLAQMLGRVPVKPDAFACAG